MIAFLEVALRLQNVQILPLDLWKAVFALGLPDTATYKYKNILESLGLIFLLQ